MLSTFVQESQRDWDLQLPYVMMAYRSSEHDTTGLTPNQMMLGRDVEIPLDLVVGLPLEEDATPPEATEYNQTLRERLNRAYEAARENTGRRVIRQKKNYDRRVNPCDLREGSPVWLYAPNKKTGISPKLQRSWEGPWMIVKKLGDVLYKIKKSQKSKPRVVHADRLRKFESYYDSDWAEKTLKGYAAQHSTETTEAACQTDQIFPLVIREKASQKKATAGLAQKNVSSEIPIGMENVNKTDNRHRTTKSGRTSKRPCRYEA